MKRRLLVLLALAFPCAAAFAQSMPPPGEMARANPPPPADNAPPPTPAKAAPAASTRTAHEDPQAIIDRLTRTNAQLLDLLKQQEDVLKDIQYSRRLQDRRIMLLEQRLEDTLQLNAALQEKASKLEAQAAVAAAAPPASASTTTPATPAAPVTPPTPVTPPAPASYLPPEQPGGAPGTMWWHRVTTLAGDDLKNSDVFHVAGKQWRVIWHNQDKPGDVYKNTSLLFINAFPAHDTVPKKICSQLGSGGDTKILNGSGDYYLKIEASGGHWECAVEDFR